MAAGLWAAAALGSVCLYLRGYVPRASHPSTSLALQHPAQALQLFAIQLGGALTTEESPSASTAFGLLLAVVALGLLAHLARRRDELDRAAFGLALMAFAAAAAAMVTIGRLGLNTDENGALLGSPSRYTTLTLLGIIGLLRVALGLRLRVPRVLGTGVVASAIALGSLTALWTEFERGAAVYRERSEARSALIDYATRPDHDLRFLYPTPATVRERARTLERLRLSVFRGE